MDQTKRFGLFAALFLAAVASACSTTVTTGNGGCPDDGLPPEGGSCPVDGQVCGQLDECGYGQQAVCMGGTWVIDWSDPGPDECGCGVDCPPPPTGCPDAQPANGSMCDSEGITCSYTDPSCSDAGAQVTCINGSWSVDNYGPACWPTCPTTAPVEGTPCSDCCLASPCEYLDASGCPAQLSCQNGVWVSSPSACTPDSTCATLGMNECLDAQGCRWMVYPTCSPALESFPQGCYPVDGCTSDADCNGGTCKTVDVDPCPAGDCNACTVQAQICVP